MTHWQTIESAPRGRERFLVIGKSKFGWWADANAYRAHRPLKREDGSVCELVYDGWSRREALYWQPLPEPPK